MELWEIEEPGVLLKQEYPRLLEEVKEDQESEHGGAAQEEAAEELETLIQVLLQIALRLALGAHPAEAVEGQEHMFLIVRVTPAMLEVQEQAVLRVAGAAAEVVAIQDPLQLVPVPVSLAMQQQAEAAEAAAEKGPVKRVLLVQPEILDHLEQLVLLMR
jgi:hypothetical protein